MLIETMQKYLERHRWSEIFPPVACIDDKTFYLEDTKSNGYLGATFFGDPLYGADSGTVNRLKAVLSTNFPEGTYIQFGLLAHSDIVDEIDRYELTKQESLLANPDLDNEQKNALWANVTTRADFFRGGVVGPMIEGVNRRLTRQLLIVSIKTPCPTSPNDKDIAEADEIFARFSDGLATVGMRMKRADESEYLALLRVCIQPDKPFDFGMNNTDFIRDQVLEPGFVLRTNDERRLDLNGLHAKILSVKRLPQRTNIGIMNFMTGDPGGLANQIPGNYYISYTLHYPDQQKAGRKVRGRYTLLVQQTSGPLGRLIPRLSFKKRGFDSLMAELDQGGLLCEAQLNLTLFSRSKDEVDRAAAIMSTYLASYRMELVEDSLILPAVFTNNLPLFPSPTATAFMRRARTMTLNQAIQFCPIIGEWAGVKSSDACIFQTRRGQIYPLDLFKSNSNYNAIIFAESGAGKSVLTQQMILDYLAKGAKVWVIDIGRSYKNICEDLKGEFIEFTDESRICLNPFTNVKDIDDELELLKSLLSKMAAPESGLDDYASARLAEAIKAVYTSKGPTMNVTDVANWLQMQEDPRLRDIGTQLFAFTIHGPHGYWFDGENNLKFNSNFVVLELEELNGKPVLQQVVLMLLMAKIQHEMYVTRSDQVKLAIFDESWALFSDPGVAKFMQHGYRRFRKYNGAAVLVLQNIEDFYRTPGMEEVAENSAHKIILMQQATSIDAIVDARRISLDEYGKQQLKSVTTAPGMYSEAMHYVNGSWAIFRLVLPDVTKVMLSTTPVIRNEIARLRSMGATLSEAVLQVARGSKK